MVNVAPRGLVPYFQGAQHMTIALPSNGAWTSTSLPQSYTKSVHVFITQTQPGSGNLVSSANGNANGHMWFHNGASDGMKWSGGGSSGVQIGSYNNGNGLQGGYIDKVRVYNLALSAAEAKQLYTADRV
jgi:hypothetical protein